MADDYETERAHFLRFLNHNATDRSGEEESLRTTPLFSLAVKHAVDRKSDANRQIRPLTPNSTDSTSGDEVTYKPRRKARARRTPSVLPQYGLLGFNIGKHEHISQYEPIMLNVHAPSSAFICGSQGSGKSYTLNCLLENCLLQDERIGQLYQPVTGLVFHYDIDSSGTVAETAYLCSRGINVKVLVSKSNFETTQRIYQAATGNSRHLTVEKFLLQPGELSVERMHKLMAFSDKVEGIPLYMEVIQRILREMAVSGKGGAFDYGEFLRLINKENLTNDQLRPMRLRLDLLESYMRWPPEKAEKKKKKTLHKLLDLQPGNLTIIDLSDPFIDSATACMLFDICLSIAKENRPSCGMVIALDEAHKYMDNSPAATNFTNRLLTTVREQRHIGTRVIVSTQEPTIADKLLDLCSISIVHHFKSPAWFAAIRNHLGGASSLVSSGEEREALFEQILTLSAGESRVFAPSAFLCVDEDGRPQRLGSAVLQMKTRTRIGVDGGMSVLIGSTGQNGLNAGN